jgi:hypothetical protein
MRDLLLGASIFALAAAAALAIHPPAPPASQQPSAVVEAGSTCADKHCKSGTRCCYSCTGNPICVVRCPECAQP